MVGSAEWPNVKPRLKLVGIYNADSLPRLEVLVADSLCCLLMIPTSLSLPNLAAPLARVAPNAKSAEETRTRRSEPACPCTKSQ
jgi:hypothetical protein